MGEAGPRARWGKAREQAVVAACRQALAVGLGVEADRQALRRKVKDCYARWYARIGGTTEADFVVLTALIRSAQITACLIPVFIAVSAKARGLHGIVLTAYDLDVSALMASLLYLGATVSGSSLNLPLRQVGRLLASRRLTAMPRPVPPDGMLTAIEFVVRVQEEVAGMTAVPATPVLAELARVLHRASRLVAADADLDGLRIPRALLAARRARSDALASVLRDRAAAVLVVEREGDLASLLDEIRSMLRSWAHGELSQYVAALTPAQPQATLAVRLRRYGWPIVLFAIGGTIWAATGKLSSAALPFIGFGGALAANLAAPADAARFLLSGLGVSGPGR